MHTAAALVAPAGPRELRRASAQRAAPADQRRAEEEPDPAAEPDNPHALDNLAALMQRSGRAAEAEALWAQLNRTARPGARVIFRTAGEETPLPQMLAPETLAPSAPTPVRPTPAAPRDAAVVPSARVVIVSL